MREKITQMMLGLYRTLGRSRASDARRFGRERVPFVYAEVVMCARRVRVETGETKEKGKKRREEKRGLGNHNNMTF